MRRAILILTISCGLAACGDSGQRNALGGVREPSPTANEAGPSNQSVAQTNGAAPAQRSESVSGTMAGWEMGDYLWARFDVAGREPVRAMVEGDPIGLFLDANRGRPVTVEITTAMMNVPEAGGQTEIARVTAARNAGGSAQAWFDALSRGEREAAQRRFEAGALSGGGR